MNAFDADVLIYAAIGSHDLGRRVLAALPGVDEVERQPAVGSVVLIPEILSRPRRLGQTRELRALQRILSRIELRPVDRFVADLASFLGARHGLRATDAIHLATAIESGADRFITNNQKDFSHTIGEIDVVYPEDLPEPT